MIPVKTKRERTGGMLPNVFDRYGQNGGEKLEMYYATFRNSALTKNKTPYPFGKTRSFRDHSMASLNLRLQIIY